MPEVEIGGSERERLVINVSSRARPNDSDYWDGNWLNAEVDVRIGGFTGRVRGNVRAEEIVGFHEQVATLTRSLNGRARFSTMEGWLAVELKGDGKGHIAVDAELLDEPGVGNRLTFHLELDQTFLPGLMANLNEIAKSFPVRGARDA